MHKNGFGVDILQCLMSHKTKPKQASYDMNIHKLYNFNIMHKFIYTMFLLISYMHTIYLMFIM